MHNEIKGVKKRYQAPLVEEMGALGDVTMGMMGMGMMGMMGMGMMNFGS